MAGFIWDQKNVDHIAEHGITRDEAEYVVLNARKPYPMGQGDCKWLVRGQTRQGRYIQVVYVRESEAAIDYTEIDLIDLDAHDDGIYVIHSRPLTPRERSGLRRKRS